MPGVVVMAHGGSAARARMVRKLRAAGATSESSARPIEPGNRFQQRGLERALRCGMIRQAKNGGYYVDEDRVAAYRTCQMRWALTALLFLALLFGILYVLGEIP